MKRTVLALAMATAMICSASIASGAQGKGRDKAPKAKSGVAQTAKVHSPKRDAQGAGKQKAGKVKTTGGKSGRREAGTAGFARSPVQQRLHENTNLADRLRGQLPADTDLILAADGFRNLGQFVAAVNVSNNLGIPFADLKARMVGDGLSLGQAIKAERPDVDALRIARRAEIDADALIARTTARPPVRK